MNFNFYVSNLKEKINENDFVQIIFFDVSD